MIFFGGRTISIKKPITDEKRQMKNQSIADLCFFFAIFTARNKMMIFAIKIRIGNIGSIQFFPSNVADQARL